MHDEIVYGSVIYAAAYNFFEMSGFGRRSKRIFFLMRALALKPTLVNEGEGIQVCHVREEEGAVRRRAGMNHRVSRPGAPTLRQQTRRPRHPPSPLRDLPISGTEQADKMSGETTSAADLLRSPERTSKTANGFSRTMIFPWEEAERKCQLFKGMRSAFGHES